MDRRTLFFVIAMSLSLFIANLFFNYYETEKRREWKEKYRTYVQKKNTELKKEIDLKTADLKSIQAVAIYYDKEGKSLWGYGVKSSDSNAVIAVNEKENIPNKVFIADHPSTLTAYNLQTISSHPKTFLQGKPVIFTKNGTLKTHFLPRKNSFEFQLFATFSGEPKVYFGKSIEGKITVLEKKRLELNSDKKNQISFPKKAIVLLKADGKYFPVGVYSSKSNQITPLTEYQHLKLQLPTKEVQTSSSAYTTTTQEEEFYVLENSYQQLVFSTIGGALTEINLPLRSSQNKDSVVRSVSIDEQIIEQSPQNAKFPLTSFKTADGKTHKQGKTGGYYPLIRRDIILKSNRTIDVKPALYALNIVSDYPEMAELNYRVIKFSSDEIVFEAKQPHRTIRKTYTLTSAPYTFNLEIDIEGDAKGLWLNSGTPEVEIISNNPAPSLKYRISRGKKSEVEKLALPKESTRLTSLYPDWISNSNGFFGIIMDPLTSIDAGIKAQKIPGTIQPSRLTLIDQEHQRFQAKNLPGYRMMLPLNPNGGTMKFRIFAGPLATNILKRVDQTFSNPDTGYNPDYIASQSYHGWFSFISQPFAKFLYIVINFFHSLTHSWAISIVLLTVVVRLMLYPLNAWSMKSMAKMQKIAPRVQKIQEKYKNDQKRAQLEIMTLYRDEGVNPISGCLPLLIQMPFLIGMFDLLKTTFELRGAVFIPGWINNLSAPDVLFTFPVSLPYFGNEFHLLPIILGAVMFLQGKLFSSAPKDPNLMTEQQRQQQAMGSMTSLLFAVMFYHFPSGLNIYWLSSMLLGMLQQWWTRKKIGIGK